MNCNCEDSIESRLEETEVLSKKLYKVVSWLLNNVTLHELFHEEMCESCKPVEQQKCKTHQTREKRKICLKCNEITKQHHAWKHACNCVVKDINEIKHSRGL